MSNHKVHMPVVCTDEVNTDNSFCVKVHDNGNEIMHIKCSNEAIHETANYIKEYLQEVPAIKAQANIKVEIIPAVIEFAIIEVTAEPK